MIPHWLWRQKRAELMPSVVLKYVFRDSFITPAACLEFAKNVDSGLLRDFRPPMGAVSSGKFLCHTGRGDKVVIR